MHPELRGRLFKLLASGLLVPPAFVLLCVVSTFLSRSLAEEGFGIALRLLAFLTALTWASMAIIHYYIVRSVRAFVRLMVILAVSIIALEALPFFPAVIAVLRYPFTLNNEGYVYLGAWGFAHGHGLYHSFANPIGGIDASYTPVFFVILAALIKIFPEGLYLLRCLTVLSTIGTLILLWRIVYRESGRLWPALTACLLPLCVNVSTYLITGRTDALAWFFAVAGYSAAVAILEPPLSMHIRPAAMLWPAALCFLAAMTKQTYFAGPAAILTFLLMRRYWATALYFTAALAGMLFVATALLTWITDGRYWFLAYIAHGYSSYSWTEAWSASAGTTKTLAILSILPLTWLWKNRNIPSRRLLSLYLLFSSCGLFLAVKLGSSYNYLIEPVGWLSVALALALHDLYQDFSAAAMRRAALLAVGTIALGVFAREWLPDTVTSREVDSGEAVVRLIKRLPRPSLSDDPYLLLLAGQQDNNVEWFLEGTFRSAFPARRKALLEVVESGKYNFIVTGRLIPNDQKPRDKDLIDVLQKHYRSVRPDEYREDEASIVDGYSVLIPCSTDCRIIEPVLAVSQDRRGSYRRPLRLLLNFLAKLVAR